MMPSSIAALAMPRANHSTAQGAFNTAQWTSYQSIPLPLLFCLRGQRHRHFHQDAHRLDRGDLRSTGPG
jgi:hypothetical protein